MKPPTIPHLQAIRIWICFAAAFCASAVFAQTINLSSGVQIYATLSNTTVNMTGACELQVTSPTTPLSGCTINLDSQDAYLILHGVNPSAVLTNYLGQVRVSGAAAVADNNCRVVQHGAAGTVVIPHPSGFQPLTVYSGPNFTGASMSLGQHVYYRSALGAMYANIGSFKLKRGYTATLAQYENGSGVSRNYVAQDGDVEVSLLPANLDHSVRFVYVMPWRWTAKKGSCDIAPADVNATWWYNWNISAVSTADQQYVAIKQQPYWPGLDQDWAWRGVNHLSGFNEPNNPVEDAYKNLSPQGSVSDAVARWPELLSTGLRVGAPAVTDGGYSWIVDFVNQAEAAGHRVDYLPIHYYRSYNDNNNPQGAANNLYNFLKSVYDATKRPIWVTEFNNGANWTTDADPTFEQNKNVIEAMINMMDGTPWIERYSVYSAVEEVRQVYYNAGGLTPMGVMYRDHVSPLAYLQGLQDNGAGAGAQLRFEADTLDDSGRGNNAVASGAPAYAAGHNGQALVFDGVNTKVTLPPNVANKTAFTFAAWVKWNGGSNWQRIFDFGNSTTHYMFLTPSSGGGTLRFAIKNGGGEQIVEAPALAQNQWQHVAVTLSGNTARLYVNGAQVAANTAMSITPASFSPRMNFLGDSQFVADPLFSGQMDDVIIKDHALSATQIAALQSDTPPQFATTVIAKPAATKFQSYSDTLAGAATDADAGDTLTYAKASGPAWLTVAANGALGGTPGAADGGANSFTVVVTDAAGMSAFATLNIAVDPADLAASYAFESNTLSDVNGTHATATGVTAYAVGQNGLAIDLDGTSTYLTLPAGIAKSDALTVATWVNPDVISTWARIFDFGASTSVNMFLCPSSGGGTLRFAINNGGGEQQLNAPALSAGVWTHVAVTLSGGTGTLYVNGTAVATNPAMSALPSSLGATTRNYIGKSQWPDPYFDGRVDDFRVYDRALGASEIAALASGGPTSPPPAPTGLSATAGVGQIALGWTASSGATSYNVKRSAASGGPYSVVGNVITTSFTDSGLSAGATYYYVVSAVNTIGESANSNEAGATTPTPPPAPWTAADIGSVGVTGGAGYGGGAYTVSGSGADIWGAADAFQFVSQTLAGDGEIRARVTSQTNTDPWAKAGVMIRDGSAPGAVNAFVAVTPANDFTFQWRASASGSSSSVAGPALNGAPNNWVRLVRSGTLVTAYVSADGAAWTQAGSATLTMSSGVSVGLAVTSHNNATASTATFDNVAVTPYPSPWLSADIGATGLVGATEYYAGAYTVKGAGSFGGAADAFRYVYQTLSADGSITVRVSTLGNTGNAARVGIMMRDTLANNARMAALSVTGSGAYRWQRRTATGGSVSTTNSGSGSAPNIWVRLVRSGNTVTASKSTNGTSWTTIGSATVTMAGNCYVGLAVASGGTTTLNTSIMDNVSVVP